MVNASTRNSSGSSVVRIIVSVALIAATAWIVLNRQAVIDQIRLLTYTPSADVKQLADSTLLQDHARNLFYVSDPEILDDVAFNASCTSDEHTIVLGCYKSQRIYLYNITDERFNGIKEVTAAHEMLHAAYERMSDDERLKVENMLKPIVEGMKDERILDLIALYNKHEPGHLYNEMHSILGTEYGQLTPELEAHYRKYFKDRQVVVNFAGQYQAVFTESENRIAEYDRQLADLKPKIDANNATLQRMEAELESDNRQLSEYRSQGEIDQYNQSAAAYNSKVARFNALIVETRTMVENYNAMVETRNNQVTAQNNLYHSIDSDYQTVQQN